MKSQLVYLSLKPKKRYIRFGQSLEVYKEYPPEASAKRVLLETKRKFSWREGRVDTRQAVYGYVEVYPLM